MMEVNFVLMLVSRQSVAARKKKKNAERDGIETQQPNISRTRFSTDEGKETLVREGANMGILAASKEKNRGWMDRRLSPSLDSKRLTLNLTEFFFPFPIFPFAHHFPSRAHSRRPERVKGCIGHVCPGSDGSDGEPTSSWETKVEWKRRGRNNCGSPTRTERWPARCP